MNIDSIHNGVVLDHIQAGKSMEIYKHLNLDKLDCSVAIIKNARSARMGKKDILKIDSPLELDLDVLGYIDPDITVNIIKDGAIKAISYVYYGANLVWQAVRSCFGSGIWVSEKSWLGDEAWKYYSK